MIAKLTGIVDSVEADQAIIDVAGIGYLVFASGATLGRLVPGDAASLMIETHVREDHIHLFAFADTDERDWFRLLTSVQGVGPKAGLAILSVLAPDALVHAVAAGDKAAVSRANGVGPKIAARVVSELKDKVANLALGAIGVPEKPTTEKGAKAPKPGASRDAVSALVNLGYGPSEALVAVAHATTALGSEAAVEALIKHGLGELGQSHSEGRA